VRDVTYGICENPLTEESRCVKSTNTTTIQECGDGRECQKGRCISLETSSAAEAPVQQTQEPEDMQTTSTSLESPQPSQQTVPTTVIAQTTSSTQPDTNKQADQPKSGNSLFLWVIMTVVLTLLILIAVVAAALALYLVYKRRIRSPEGNKRTMFSSAKNRSRL
jgi:cobalamin biosynthesis Mg chelatase CobN